MPRFDYLIANPPYGKGTSFLSKTMTENFILRKVSKKFFILATPKTFLQIFPYVEVYKGYRGKDTCNKYFKEVYLNNLGLASLNLERINKYESYADLILEEKEKVYRNAVLNYNRTHRKSFYENKGCAVKENKSLLKTDESLVFLVQNWVVKDGVYYGGETYKHNVLKERIDYRPSWGGRTYCMVFASKTEYENFSKWWYDDKSKLLRFCFRILHSLYGSPNLKKYHDVLPNLDWNREWKDSDILKEIGLSENFLG